MIRSHLDFAGPLFNDISDHNKTKLKSIQYHSMRAILNKKYGTSSREMHETLCIETLDDHFIKLKNNYLFQALAYNPMIRELFDEYIQFADSNNITDSQYSLFGEY